jgi:hypothetical protein
MAGCGDDGLQLGEVSGKVTLDGKPVPNAFISFDPQFKGRPSSAMTDANGSYELRFNPTRWGALVGDHQVRISTEDATPDDKLIPELIPQAYRGTNGFIPVTVKSGENTIDFELKSDAGKPSPSRRK